MTAETVAALSPPPGLGVAAAPGPSPELEHLAKLYREMLLIRRVEEESARGYAQGKIGGFLHLYIGQEAVGRRAPSQLSSRTTTSSRRTGTTASRSRRAWPRARCWRSSTARRPAARKGLGGSMHMFDKEHHMLGGYGIVGGHIPLAAGVAFASKYRGDGRVTLCFFGEGAVSIGGFHEGVALAALWKLPIVFICENNEYSMGTPLSRSMSVEDVSLKALGYGMDRDRFFADDVLEVEQRIGEAVKRARESTARPRSSRCARTVSAATR